MAELGKKLGTLSLAILENFVEGTLGKKFVDELRAPTDREIAIAAALERTETLFADGYEDRDLSTALFVDLKQADRPVLKEAVRKYFDHPTDPSLRQALQSILFDEFKEVLSAERINRAVDFYLRLLTKELMLADEAFRSAIASLASYEGNLAEKRTVEILEAIAAWIVQQQKVPQAEVHPTIGFIPPVRAWKYILRGKEDEVAALLKNGGTGAIVGVHAPGGLGKTELAKYAWEIVKSGFEDILWVDVGEKTPAEVIDDMLLQCGIRLEPAATYAERRAALRACLKTRRLLVTLDDVRQKAADQIADLLPPKPCACLVTSRIQQIGGVTRTFELEPMTPAQARELMEAALGSEAVAAEDKAAARLAERCRFNPLALEIAVRRILQDRGPARIANYLKKVEARFAELKMAGDRRWDMTAVFDISYNDLSPADQRRFRALAVFHSTGFSLDAAARVWGEDATEADLALARLVNLSLVIKLETAADRYRLHDLLDEYAAPVLARSGEEEAARQALAEWLIELFAQHYTDDPSAAPHVFLELENLKNAAEWALKTRNARLLALLATSPRNWLYNVFRINDEWLTWLKTSLEIGVDVPQLEANVRKAIGDVQQFRKEIDAALESYNAALSLFRQVGDKLGEANTYLSLGGLKRAKKDFSGAREDFQNALEMYKKIGDNYSQARALYRLGDIFSDEGRYGEAIEQYEQAALLWNAIGVIDLVENILRPRIEEARKHL
ncbi:MAG: hypothetical protein OHK0041_18250 [Anaerolineales bacterium]